jgi:hypothetical protein
MERELKISVSIFLVFFIFGLTSYFNSGSFATPVFMQHFIYVPLAVLFYLMNLKSKHSFILLIYAAVCMLAFLLDEFSQQYLANKMENNVLYDVTQSASFSIIFLIIYFGFFVFQMFYLLNKTKQYVIFSLQIILLVFTIYAISHEDLFFYSGMLFSAHLILYVFAANKFMKSDSKVVSVLSAQFTLLFLLQICQYFV